MKKRYLEMILDNLKPHPNPKSNLEQYTMEGKLASEILFFAKEDILNNFVIDLGCGTGKLSIGAKLIGASSVIGIDIDEETLNTAQHNLKNLKNIELINKLYSDEEITNIIKNIQFINEDVKNLNMEFISKYKLYENNNQNKENNKAKNIIIQNPPFGSQKKYADRIFLEKALEVGDIIYTIHNTPTRDFIINYIESKNRTITNIFQADFKISKIYEFHKKKFINVPVDIYRIE